MQELSDARCGSNLAPSLSLPKARPQGVPSLPEGAVVLEGRGRDFPGPGSESRGALR